MERLTLKITDETKINFLLELPGELDFMEVNSYSVRKESIDVGLIMSEEAIKYGDKLLRRILKKNYTLGERNNLVKTGLQDIDEFNTEFGVKRRPSKLNL